jgi:hypothetical protein
MVNNKRNSEAENVAEVLLQAYKQQQSGLLHIERAWEGRTEKGELYILTGQPIYARAGKLSGQAALEFLLSWRSIRFSLIPDASRPPANLSSRLRISSPTPPPVSSPTPPPVAPPPRPLALPAANRNAPARLIPRKSMERPAGLLSSLTRHQRMIYFLVDGQRTIDDLARCSSKEIAEVEAIARELQQLGLIDF